MLNTIDVDVADRMDQLRGLYACYHKQWLCRLQMFNYFKRCHTACNVVTLVILALNVIVGSVWKEIFAVLSLTAAATFVKGWSDLKKYSQKMDMSRFAYSTHEKTLIELKTFARGADFDITSFLIKMKTLDDIVTDFAPPMSERFRKMYSEKF